MKPCPPPIATGVADRPVVVVRWRDAVSRPDVHLCDASHLEPVEVLSYGQLVTYDTNKLVLAQSVVDAQIAQDALVIPADWVVTVHHLLALDDKPPILPKESHG